MTCGTSVDSDGPAGCAGLHDDARSAEYAFIAAHSLAAVAGGVGAYLLLGGSHEAAAGSTKSVALRSAPSVDPRRHLRLALLDDVARSIHRRATTCRTPWPAPWE
jgi:hypothetical protein